MSLTTKQIRIVDNLVEMRHSIVPIIGEDVFYVMDEEHNARMSIQEYLTNCFVCEYDDVNVSDEALDIMRHGGYYGLSKMAATFSEDFVDNYRSYIKRAQTGGRIKMDETVYRFLSAFRFPLIVTTSCFDILESVLNNGSVRYSSVSYNIEGECSIVIDQTKYTVYHIFGMIADGANWVYDESQLLEFMHALHDKDTTSRNLKKYLDTHSSRLLVLGCNLPDWLFRFLWYPIKNDRHSSVSARHGYWLNQLECDDSFTDFLSNIKFFSTTEVDGILAYATSKVESIKASEAQIEDERFDAFMSYASEDLPIATRIYDILTQKGYRVWFDKDGQGKITPGSNYMRKIESGVRNSTRYIPIITENFIAKVCNPESNLKKETDIIRDHAKTLDNGGDGYSLPIIINGRIYNDEDRIDSTFVEGMTRYVLPKILFYNINMYLFNETDTDIDIIPVI